MVKAQRTHNNNHYSLIGPHWSRRLLTRRFSASFVHKNSFTPNHLRPNETNLNSHKKKNIHSLAQQPECSERRLQRLDVSLPSTTSSFIHAHTHCTVCSKQRLQSPPTCACCPPQRLPLIQTFKYKISFTHIHTISHIYTHRSEQIYPRVPSDGLNVPDESLPPTTSGSHT